MSEPKVLFPKKYAKYNIEEILSQLPIGKVKIDENDTEDYLINKIDNNTIIIENGKLKALINIIPEENKVIKFNYSNDLFDPDNIEISDLNGNLIEQESYVYDNDKNITQIKKYDSNGVLKMRIDITYKDVTYNSNVYKVIDEVRSELI